MNFKKFLIGTAAGALVLGAVAVSAFAAQPASTGFDQFGYNYQARNFVGPADGVDRTLDGNVWGDPTYANDHLIMKWSKAWDDARFHGAPWTSDAWVDNEWNGQVPGGSGVSEHTKIIWIGLPDNSTNPLWRPGGYAIWGEFEAIFDHYTCSLTNSLCPTELWQAHAVPAGYGGN